nr:hypothetical protein Clen_458 [Cedratvirus lena]
MSNSAHGMSTLVRVLGRQVYFPSLRDLACEKILSREPVGPLLDEFSLDYLEEYKKKRFIDIFFVADLPPTGKNLSFTGMAFIKQGRHGNLSYEVTSLEKVIIIFSVGGCEIKLDLPLSKLTQTLSIAFCDYQVFVKHGNSFSTMHVLEREKYMTI